MIIKFKTLLTSTLLLGLIQFGCAGSDEQIEEAVPSDELSELSSEDSILENSEEAMDLAQEMEHDYADDSFDTPDLSPEDEIEDVSSISEEAGLSSIDAVPTYADQNRLSYSDDMGLPADEENAQVDFYDSSEDTSPITMDPVSSPEPIAKAQPKSAPKKSSAPKAKIAPSSKEDGYIVQVGDTLAIIASKLYGDSSRWKELAEANNIGPKQTIFPGDRLTFDTNNAQANSYINSMNQAMESITVQKGDTLSSISVKVFGTSGAWKVLYELNADQISNPDRIFAGQVLKYSKLSQSAMTH